MQLKIEKGTFKDYPLEDISDALRKGLSENFKNVEVEVVDCPNLRDWDCPSEGISGNQKIIDVGGEPYMHDPKFIGAEFDYEEISKMIDSEKSYALGAGSGAMGCLFGGLLAEKGLNVILIDVWKEHVDAINKHGLKMDGHGGDRVIKVKATSCLLYTSPSPRD